MSSKNRFSYNLAVTSPENEELYNRPLEMNKHPQGLLQLQFRTGSQKMHQKTLSTGSSTRFCDFEEEELSTINESLDWLLNGENLVHREFNIGFRKQDKPERTVYGRIYVTNYRLRFEERITTNKKEQQELIKFDVTLGSVSKIDKIGYYNVRRSTNGPEEAPYGLNIICKDFRNIKLLHRRESHGRRALYDCLRLYAFPNTNRLPFFAKIYTEKFHQNGWKLFEVVNEFNRQKIPNSKWKLSHINEHYEFAATYPALFYVPSDVYRQNSPEHFLNCVSKFRSKKRIPVLSWIDSQTCAALIRSSQPMVGVSSRKSESDEDYIEMIINANPNSEELVILDARPSINAKANRANGGGYENYARCRLKFMDIQNIHVVRDSLRKLKDACFPTIRQKYFQSTLEETKWLAHLQTILEAAALAAREISLNKNSVLVHCSDGWDRTAQITSLAMLQLDPYYRTIEGFAVLVEKEWCSFGHKFAHRIGHGQDKHDDKERSPIFVQFIDCVWQLYNQFTTAFQFNVRFLKTILDELYSCRFGTFLFNSERERMELEVNEIMASLWSFILDNRIYFTNDKYNYQSTLNDFIMQPSKIYPLFWTDYYCRYSLLLPADNEDQLSLAGSSIGPSTPLTIIPQQMSLTENFKNNDYTMNYNSAAKDEDSNSLTPTFARPQKQPSTIPPETPARQRRWLPTSIPQENEKSPSVNELKKQFLVNTSPIPSPGTGSNNSSTASERQIITRV